jgi:hypothetical protein
MSGPSIGSERKIIIPIHKIYFCDGLARGEWDMIKCNSTSGWMSYLVSVFTAHGFVSVSAA